MRSNKLFELAVVNHWEVKYGLSLKPVYFSRGHLFPLLFRSKEGNESGQETTETIGWAITLNADSNEQHVFLDQEVELDANGECVLITRSQREVMLKFQALMNVTPEFLEKNKIDGF